MLIKIHRSIIISILMIALLWNIIYGRKYWHEMTEEDEKRLGLRPSRPSSSSSSSSLFDINNDAISLDQKQHIFGGYSPAFGTWKFIVHVFLRSGEELSGCTGSLINHDTVLTAAHCLIDHKPEDVVLVFGNFDPELIEHRRKYFRNASELIIHENFTAADDDIRNDISYDYKKRRSYDIGLIKFDEKIETDVFVDTIDLADSVEDMSKLNCFAIGYGQRYDVLEPVQYTPGLDELREVRLPWLEPEICARLFYEYQYPQQLCFGYKQSWHDCRPPKQVGRGDSGGPLVCRPEAPMESCFIFKFLLYGVITSARQMYTNEWSDVAITTTSSIVFHRSWISRHAKILFMK